MIRKDSRTNWQRKSGLSERMLGWPGQYPMHFISHPSGLAGQPMRAHGQLIVVYWCLMHRDSTQELSALQTAALAIVAGAGMPEAWPIEDGQQQLSMSLMPGHTSP